MARMMGDLRSSRVYYESALRTAREIGYRTMDVRILRELASMDMVEHDHESARRHMEQALEAVRAVGDRQNEAWCLGELGYALFWLRDYPGSRSCFEAALEINRDLDNPWGLVGNYLGLGKIAGELGDMEGVYRLYRMALLSHGRYAKDRETALCLEELAYYFGRKGHSDRAARLLGAAEALREALNVPMDGNEREKYGIEVARLKADTGAKSLEKAWLEGRAMSLEQIVACTEGKPI
jgi:tetratricopeptide (TPR) repeat protein